MPEPLTPALSRLRGLVLDDHRLVRAIGTGRRRNTQPTWRRVELRYVELKAGRRLQVTAYDATQAHTRNVALDDAVETVDELLAEPFQNWHVDTAHTRMQLRVTKKGEAQVHTSPAAGRSTASTADTADTADAAASAQPSERVVDRAHDRSKPRMVDSGDPLLSALGITTRDGTVKTRRRGKYHQVEEFVRLAAPSLDDALRAGHLRQPSAEHPLRVVDLGCGNAYLTFAAYRFLADTRGLPVTLTGVDVKAQARERNTRLAAELGWADRTRFVEADIDAVEIDEPPDVMLSLHACDTATDDALARAVRWQTPLVLAAPCCHHDLQTQLRHHAAPPPYGLLTRHGILRERVADVLTDALRAAVLRLLGYRVDVVEFVGSTHTPRNLLLRATRTGARPSDDAIAEYRTLVAEWNITPALARRLAAELTEVHAR